MSQIKLHLQSFNSGELSESMGQRFGVEKVATGCRKLRNFMLDVHGPATKRPGMGFIGSNTDASARSHLIPFNFSTTTTFMLEANPAGLRVWSNGALVTLDAPVAWPYTETETEEVQTTQINDVLYLAHANHPPRKITRVTDTNWKLEEVPWLYPPLLDEYFRTGLAIPPSAVQLLQVKGEIWGEAQAAVGDTFQVTWSGGTGTNTVVLERWTGSAWTTVNTRSGSAATYVSPVFTVATSGVHRINVTAQRSGVTGSAVLRPPIPAFPLPAPSPLITVDLGLTQPVSKASVSVPIGDWQVKVDGTNSTTVPAGVSGKVQQFISGSWSDVSGGALTLTPGKFTTVSPTAVSGSAKLTRILWAGNAWPNATVSINRLEYPASSDVTMQTSDTTGTGKTLTCSVAKFEEGHVGSYWQLAHRRDTAYAEVKATASWGSDRLSGEVRMVGSWDLFSYGTWTSTVHLERERPDGSWEVIRTWVGDKDRNIIANGTEDQEANLRIRLVAGGTSSGTPLGRFILEAADARVYGVVKITSITSATVAVCDIVQTVHATTATALWTEGAFSAYQGYPRSVCAHGARVWWGGTKKQPSRLWGSVINDIENFRRSTFDDAGVSFTGQSGQSHPIHWLASQGREMLMGTAGDEWLISSEGPIITAADATFKRQSTFGSTYLPALLVNESVVWIQRGGKKVRRVSPRSDANTWSVADLTVLASHVTGTGIRQVAFMSNPTSILWAVTEEGKLIGMTYETEQNVFGWHVHETDGIVESVAVIYGSGADEVWLEVERNGARNIERLDPVAMERDMTEWETMLFCDAAVRRTGPSTTFTVAHLQGRTVVGLADGVPFEGTVSEAGVLTLPASATAVIVGLPYTATLQPMRMDLPMQDGTSQARLVKVARVGARVIDSMSGQVADGTDGVFETLPYRHGPGLFTGMVETAITSRTADDVNVCVKDSKPLPFTVAGLVLKLDVFGD